MIVRSGVWISVCFLSFWNVSRDCLRCHRPDPLVIMEQLCCRFLRFFKNVSHCLSKGLACRWLDRPALQERLAPRALLVEVSARVSTSLLDCGPTLNARDKSVPSMWHVAETTSEPLERPQSSSPTRMACGASLVHLCFTANRSREPPVSLGTSSTAEPENDSQEGNVVCFRRYNESR